MCACVPQKLLRLRELARRQGHKTLVLQVGQSGEQVRRRSLRDPPNLQKDPNGKHDRPLSFPGRRAGIAPRPACRLDEGDHARVTDGVVNESVVVPYVVWRMKFAEAHFAK